MTSNANEDACQYRWINCRGYSNYNLKSKYWLTSQHIWRGFVKRVLNRYAETGLIEKEFDNQTSKKSVMNIQRGNNTELKYEAKRGGKTFNPNHLRINIFQNSKPCY